MTPTTSAARTPGTRQVEHVMGTVVSFDLRGTGDHDAAIDAAVRWLHDADHRFSTYRTDSEVSRLGRGDLAPDDASEDLRAVIAACDAVGAVSRGAFAATRGGRFDPSGYVKGWAVERAGAILRASGCEDWSIGAGGDVRVSSSSAFRPPWRIGVQHPFERDRLATIVHAHDLAVATSGRYERGDHLDDPRVGAAATSVASTTVCGPDLGLADAYATAAFVLGEDGPAFVAELPGYECWSVLDDHRVLATAGFPRLVHGVPVTTGRHTDDLLGAA